MDKPTKEQAILFAWGLAGMSAVWYGYTVWSERRKRKGIDAWVKAELDAIEIERKEKGL